MSRRTLAVFVVGWLLGIVTALVTPTLIRPYNTASPPATTRLCDDALARRRQAEAAATQPRADAYSITILQQAEQAVRRYC